MTDNIYHFPSRPTIISLPSTPSLVTMVMCILNLHRAELTVEEAAVIQEAEQVIWEGELAEPLKQVRSLRAVHKVWLKHHRHGGTATMGEAKRKAKARRMSWFKLFRLWTLRTHEQAAFAAYREAEEANEPSVVRQTIHNHAVALWKRYKEIESDPYYSSKTEIVYQLRKFKEWLRRKRIGT